jgi:hypothetical protein
MTVYIQVEFKDGSSIILDVQEYEVKKYVRKLRSLTDDVYNYVVNVTVIQKGLQ